MDEKYRRGRDGYEAARYQFVITELELAFTFANIAASKDGSDGAQRNLGHARQAYDAAIHHLNERPMNPQRRREVQSRIRKFKKLLAELPAHGRRITFK